MNLYLIRHADAAPLEGSGLAGDEDRPLSDKGLRQAELLAHGFKRVGIRLDQIATSPLVRARQTAEMLQKELQPAVEIITSESLAPGKRSKRLAKFLAGMQGEHVALVGHEPDLGRHAGWLIGGRKAHIELAKGAVACIACNPRPGRGTGALLWLITPQWLGS